MILIDSLYINNGGGKVLLTYLVEILRLENIPVFYLFDSRGCESFSEVPADQKKILKATFYNRWKFYRSNGHLYNRVLCFGNVPPPLKIRASVYTYFHQNLFLEIPSGTSIKNKLIFRIKSLIWKSLRHNSNFWLVQSETMAIKVKRKLNLLTSEVLVLPFYPPLSSDLFQNKGLKNSFLYVSAGTTHKNHPFLIEAFCAFYDKNKKGTLGLTVGDDFKLLVELIKEKINLGYPIFNYGQVPRSKLAEVYPHYEYHVYPSLSESFGLGILESIEGGCKVIGANFPYTFAVCAPSIIFDPFKSTSLEKAFEKALAKDESETKQLIFNDIKKLLSLLDYEENKK